MDIWLFLIRQSIARVEFEPALPFHERLLFVAKFPYQVSIQCTIITACNLGEEASTQVVYNNELVA